MFMNGSIPCTEAWHLSMEFPVRDGFLVRLVLSHSLFSLPSLEVYVFLVSAGGGFEGYHF